MLCPSCQAENAAEAEACFTCGKALHVLTQGTVLAGRYEVRSPLGKGGMGRVYRAYDRVLEEEVALKVLRPEFAREPEMARRFLSEIKLARRISHGNVCRIHEYSEEGPLRFISMELIAGLTLKEYLKTHPLTVREAYDVAIQVCQGLQAVHEQGIVHRDFKASNIMIDERGRARLLDFGIAKEAGADTTGVPGAGHLMGTPEYMSPEQLRGGRVDARSDIYALGCVVFEIFTGQPPFQGDTAAHTMYLHLHDPPPLTGVGAAQLPKELTPLLVRALAKNPAERYRDVATFAEDLRRARAGLELPEPERAEWETRPVALAPPARTSGAGAPAPRRHHSVDTTTLQRPGPASAITLPLLRRGAVTARLLAAVGVILALGVLAWWWRASRAVPAAEAEVPRRAPQTVAVATPSALPPPSPTPVAPSPRVAPVPAVRRSPGPAPSPAAPSPLAVLLPSASVPSPRPEPAAETGVLRLLVVPEAEVTLDGVSLGPVSLRETTLPAGGHVVRILHRDYEPLQRKVTVRAGETTKLVIDLRDKGIPRRP